MNSSPHDETVGVGFLVKRAGPPSICLDRSLAGKIFGSLVGRSALAAGLFLVFIFLSTRRIDIRSTIVSGILGGPSHLVFPPGFLGGLGMM